MLLLLSSACSQPCTTTECKQEAVHAAWATDPEEARRLLDEVAVLDRELIVRSLVERDATAAPLCELLSDGPVKHDCHASVRRPHLRTDLRHAPLDPSREAVPILPNPWHAAAHGDPNTALARAVGAADQGAAAAACLDATSGTARDECFFRASEDRADLGLCQGAGGFVGPCLNHGALALSKLAPAADREGWDPLIAALSDADAGLGPLAPTFDDMVWSEALARSYSNAGALGGHPLDQLPEAAAPHVRAALAWRYTEEHPVVDFERALGHLQAVLEGRPPHAAPPRRMPTPGSTVQLRPVLVGLAGGEVRYLGRGMRPVLDGDEDLALCLLLAAAQRGQLSESILEHAGAHPALAETAEALRGAR